MTEPEQPPRTLHSFVDEAGAPMVLDAKGRILVGQEGGSKTFILGKLDVEDPAALHAALEELRADLLAGPYFKRVPSMQATRGNKARTHTFRSAIEKAESRFESQFGVRRSAEVAIVASTPPQKAGLQAVDYFLWALQSHYERDESRYVELVWDKVIEIEDLDRIEGGRKGVVYNKKRPLVVDQEASE